MWIVYAAVLVIGFGCFIKMSVSLRAQISPDFEAEAKDEACILTPLYRHSNAALTPFERRFNTILTPL